jgi:hypothetical protein
MGIQNKSRQCGYKYFYLKTQYDIRSGGFIERGCSFAGSIMVKGIVRYERGASSGSSTGKSSSTTSYKSSNDNYSGNNNTNHCSSSNSGSN